MLIYMTIFISMIELSSLNTLLNVEPSMNRLDSCQIFTNVLILLIIPPAVIIIRMK